MDKKIKKLHRISANSRIDERGEVRYNNPVEISRKTGCVLLQKKLCAVDIDGTLVTDDKTLLPQTKADIHCYIREGGIFVLASGRPTRGILRYVEELDLKTAGGFVISYNGARIINTQTNEIVLQKNIDPACYPAVLAAAEELNLPLTAYKQDIAVTQKATDRYFLTETSINQLTVEYVPNLEEELTYPTPKFLITGEPETLGEAEIRLRERLSDLPVTVFRSEPFYLEITARGCDKGTSILELANLLHIKQSETMACGDGFNDVTMLSAVGLGVAMANAQLPAKSAANYVTASNNNNGVGKAIQKFAM